MRDPLVFPRPAFPLLITHPFELCYPLCFGGTPRPRYPGVLKHAGYGLLACDSWRAAVQSL